GVGGFLLLANDSPLGVGGFLLLANDSPLRVGGFLLLANDSPLRVGDPTASLPAMTCAKFRRHGRVVDQGVFFASSDVLGGSTLFGGSFLSVPDCCFSLSLSLSFFSSATS